jgi:hypothetical protein
VSPQFSREDQDSTDTLEDGSRIRANGDAVELALSGPIQRTQKPSAAEAWAVENVSLMGPRLRSLGISCNAVLSTSCFLCQRLPGNKVRRRYIPTRRCAHIALEPRIVTPTPSTRLLRLTHPGLLTPEPHGTRRNDFRSGPS